MPPFINTKCANCTQPNRFDLYQLRKENGHINKGADQRIEDKMDEEFEVICQVCGRKFKFSVEGRHDGTKK
jgi:hypothetical protein